MPQLTDAPMLTIVKSAHYSSLEIELSKLLKLAKEVHADQTEESTYGIQNTTGLLLELLTGTRGSANDGF
jgi:hypothetical protein